MSVTNLAVLSMPMFTEGPFNYQEFLDIHQLVLNSIILLACIHVISTCCYRFPSLIRLISGSCLVVANLAYPIGIFVKISQHNVGFGGGCNGYEYGYDDSGSEADMDDQEQYSVMKTRCYMQYLIGTLNMLMACLLAVEVGLSWRMSRDREYLDLVAKERQEIRLREMQRRQRAMMVHQYQPDLTLEDHGDDMNDSTAGDELPEYQQRETTVGLGRLVDMGHFVNGEAEEVCPHPYIEQEEAEGEGRDTGYLDPSPFSAEDIEAQAGQPTPLTEGSGGGGGGSRTNGDSESEVAIEAEADEGSRLSTVVVVPMGLPPSYTP
ncbi:hypothetical protein EC957_010160 [Mortierella hygrophila]|uniref:Uncharacterized protein n=1 Tax=Mortierella hygrophila TaxID=979708 RepID=A0A9P6FAI6_9FUNG|nr:hypothetical protein EC957_010160 [Mortierella hygrophila]